MNLPLTKKLQSLARASDLSTLDVLECLDWFGILVDSPAVPGTPVLLADAESVGKLKSSGKRGVPFEPRFLRWTPTLVRPLGLGGRGSKALRHERKGMAKALGISLG